MGLSTTFVTLFSGAALASGQRKAADFSNTDGGGSPYMYHSGWLLVEATYDATTPPPPDSQIARISMLPEVGGVYPTGGDGTVGDDVEPQHELGIGIVVSRNPVAGGTERFAVPIRHLPPLGVRFVLSNLVLSGTTTFTLTAQMQQLFP